MNKPEPRTYMAASVPRNLRQTRLSYLPSDCVIGSRCVNSNGSNVVVDIIMLPVPEFHRMRTNVGIQHIPTPELKMAQAMPYGFIFTDIKQITVPPAEQDPKSYARDYFLMEFDLLTPSTPQGN